MSTQQAPTFVPIDPNDPRLHTIEKERLPGEYDSPQARRLYELTLRNKAQRTEDCTKLGRMGTCPNGHKSRQVSLCGLRFCLFCALGLSDKLYQQWRTVLELIEATEQGRFWYVEVSAPLDRSTDAMETFRDNYFSQPVQRCMVDKDGGVGPMWDFFASYSDGCLDFRSLVFGADLTLEEWCAIFPGAKVRVHHVPVYRLSHFFKELLAPTLPRVPVERAELEALFEGMHRLRAKGVSAGATTNLEDFSVGGSDSTEKCERDIEPEPAQGLRRSPRPHIGAQFAKWRSRVRPVASDRPN